MKRFFSLIGLALVFTLFSFQSDVEGMLMDLKFGNVDQVANHFYDYIEMKLPDDPNVKNMSRMDAKNSLKFFFNRNGIKGFEKEDDQVDGTNKMITGKLTSKSKEYNMTMILRQVSGKNVIVAIRVI
jgi:hypothetical protein